eukprot:GABV01001276.1.p2 GENE.GABV01001276.1~~GABV01001276.1.p2  ORF type:complete len:166 (+),score=10.43 GABV01001276.1:355-852(+)
MKSSQIHRRIHQGNNLDNCLDQKKVVNGLVRNLHIEIHPARVGICLVGIVDIERVQDRCQIGPQHKEHSLIEQIELVGCQEDNHSRKIHVTRSGRCQDCRPNRKPVLEEAGGCQEHNQCIRDHAWPSLSLRAFLEGIRYMFGKQQWVHKSKTARHARRLALAVSG